MELGHRIRQARLEAGLSQRQLCSDFITRNMLSQIEHGTAQPSMGTLRYLAARLGKSVSYFLGEQALESPNVQVMDQIRQAFDAGRYSEAIEAMKSFQEPDEVFGREKALMECLCCLNLAEKALEENRGLYALELLDRASEAETASGFRPLTERRRLMLLGKIRSQGLAEICRELPSLDEELMLRAKAALEVGELPRAAALLEAAEDKDSPKWNLLRGRVCLAQCDYSAAAEYLHWAEDTDPETLPLLEQCYLKMGDFPRAYEYACKQR